MPNRNGQHSPIRFVSAVLLLTASAFIFACSAGSATPNVRVAAAPSLAQAGCEPVPIHFMDSDSVESRTGPELRYLNLGLSPSGASVAAVHRLNACTEEGPETSLAVIDSSDLSVDEHGLIAIEHPALIDWSPGEEMVAIFGRIHGVGTAVILWDVEARKEAAMVELSREPLRHQLIWPMEGLYDLVFIDGSVMKGVSLARPGKPAQWEFECGDPSEQLDLLWLEYDGEHRVNVRYTCNTGGTSQTNWAATLDLRTATMGRAEPAGPVEGAEGIATMSKKGWADLLSHYPGAYPGSHYGRTSDGALFMTTFVHSPTLNMQEHILMGPEAVPDAATFLAVERAGADTEVFSLEFVPFLAAAPSPLHDAALLR
jgi:hypothetical protein